MTTPDDRAKFEAWCRTQPGHPYAGVFLNLAWRAWQAAISGTAQVAADGAPVAEFVPHPYDSAMPHLQFKPDYNPSIGDRLYDAPTAASLREQEPLDDFKISAIFQEWNGASYAELMRMVEKAHGIGVDAQRLGREKRDGNG